MYCSVAGKLQNPTEMTEMKKVEEATEKRLNGIKEGATRMNMASSFDLQNYAVLQ